MKSFVFLIYSDSLNGAKNFERYFARLYVAVLMLDTIGLIGKSSMFPCTVIVCILAVPYNFPGHDPVGHSFLYSCSVVFDFVFRKVP